MLIEVIPFSGSIDDMWLTYYVRDELAPDIRVGCLVEVPFRSSLDYAVVSSRESQDIPENPKSIVRIVTSLRILSSYEIRTIFDLASYYFVHTHHILSLFLSKSFLKYAEKKDFSALKAEEDGQSETKDREQSIIGFYHHTGSSPFLEKVHDKTVNSTVLVFPDDFSIEAYLRTSAIDPENTLVIYDRLTDTSKYKAFYSVYNREKNIIIWTRRVLYYNLRKYKNILYVEDSLHKSAMRFWHTYRHLEVLRRIASHGHFDISILSSLPSVESMYLLHTGVYQSIKN